MTLRNTRKKHAKQIRAAVARAAVFLYALFLLMPHFGPVTHVHMNGGAGHEHVHATASRHDVALERAVLALVPEGAPRLELGSTQVARHSVKGKHTEGPQGLKDFKDARHDLQRASLTDRDARAHTHAARDPNLVALGAPAFAAAEPARYTLEPDAVPGFVPTLARLASPARAPPAHV